MDNSFSKKYETYINEQFIGRDSWITAKSISESMLLKVENNGIVFGQDGYMFEKYFTTEKEKFDDNVGFFKEFAGKYPDQKITFSIIPSAYQVLKDKIPFGLMNVNQEKAILEAYESLSFDNVSTLDLVTPLSMHQDEYIYYRTDHHWTTLGAYYAYVAYCEQNGLTPVDISTLKANTVPDFYGTHYSKAKRPSIDPDTLTYYDVPITSIEVNMEKSEGLYDLEQLKKRDKYAMFLHSNNGLTVIKSDNNKNKVADKTTRILVVKDSFTNSLAPYLTYNYDEVYLVDLRYLSALSTVTSMAEFDDILVMYNYMNFTTDTNVAKLKY